MCLLQGGRSVHKGGGWGIGSGEGPSISNAPRHTVKIFNHHADQDIDVEVPEDRSVTLVLHFPTPNRYLINHAGISVHA